MWATPRRRLFSYPVFCDLAILAAERTIKTDLVGTHPASTANLFPCRLCSCPHFPFLGEVLRIRLPRCVLDNWRDLARSPLLRILREWQIPNLRNTESNAPTTYVQYSPPYFCNNATASTEYSVRTLTLRGSEAPSQNVKGLVTLTSKTLGSRILPGMDDFLSADHESGCGMVPLVISSINGQWPTTNGKCLPNVTLPLQLKQMRIAALTSVELNLLVLSLAIQPQGLCWSNHGPPSKPC